MSHEDVPATTASPELDGAVERVTRALETLHTKDPELANAIKAARSAGLVSPVAHEWTPGFPGEPKDGYRQECITALSPAPGRRSSLTIKDLRGEERPSALAGIKKGMQGGGLLEVKAEDSAGEVARLCLTGKFIVTTTGNVVPVETNAISGTRMILEGRGEPDGVRSLALSTAEAIVEQSMTPEDFLSPEQRADNLDQ